MDYKIMTMDELEGIHQAVLDEIKRRNKIEEEKAKRNFIEAFTRLNDLNIIVAYEGHEETYELEDPERFHFYLL